MMADNGTRGRTTGLVLAGGRARRMGGMDKGLIELAGKPMVRYVVDALDAQCERVLVCANRNQTEYARCTGRRVLGDAVPGYAGPLAGMAAGLGVCETEFLVTAPCDSPLVAADLVARLHEARERERAELAVAHDGERMQPVFALLSVRLRPSLLHFLDGGGRKIDAWYQRHRTALADFADRDDMFLNINTPAERDALARRLTEPRREPVGRRVRDES